MKPTSDWLVPDSTDWFGPVLKTVWLVPDSRVLL
jgi:hypothetical protein